MAKRTKAKLSWSQVFGRLDRLGDGLLEIIARYPDGGSGPILRDDIRRALRHLRDARDGANEMRHQIESAMRIVARNSR